MFNTEEILHKYNLFWQYPAITEKAFYLQNKDNPEYLGLPWATIVDKKYSFQIIYNIIKPYIQPGKVYYTCCQHISFRFCIPIWKAFNIKTVFVVHKCKGENILEGITLKPCPLYAVNIENTEFNNEFQGLDLLNVERNILYNFIGGYQMGYMSKIRPNIFNMKHPENTIIKHTGDWHFNKLVYNPKQNVNIELNLNDEHINKTKYYNELLIKSRYTLAPSGSGPNSIRFWEALGAGSIPVLLADTLELPEHELWNDAVIFMKEREICSLSEKIANISEERERQMRENCLNIYMDFRNNYKNMIKTNKIDFLIDIPINLIGPYFKVFGHFFGDHFFQLFKIKKWYEKEYNKQVENIIINNYDILLKHAPFIQQFYKCLFKNINITGNNDIVNLNVILGSIINSETNKLYYLSHTSTISTIPLNILDNIRKPTEFNKILGKELRDLILEKLNITIEDKSDNDILIINRKNSRKLLQLEKLCNILTNNNYKYNIVCFEDYNLSEQIKLVRSYKNVITACGSVQVHISFMKENSKWIELSEVGFRYPNTSVYGNRFNINTYMLCSSLTNNLSHLRNININTKNLFEMSDNYPNIITNSLSDIEREVIWYTQLLSPSCINCYGKLHGQDIYCNDYIDIIINILNNY
jgi:hypothetical protein